MGLLAAILADMLSSALAWERDHGELRDKPAKDLTCSSPAYKLLSQETTRGGEKDDSVMEEKQANNL